MVKTVLVTSHGANSSTASAALTAALANGSPFRNSNKTFQGSSWSGVLLLPWGNQLSQDLTTRFYGDAPPYVVWSYSTPIAWRSESGEWIVPNVTYSLTTTRHQSQVRFALSRLVHLIREKTINTPSAPAP